MSEAIGSRSISRRTLIVGGSALVLTPAAIWLALREQRAPLPVGEDALAWVRMLADLVIPATETPGAAEVGVAEFVALAAQHGLAGAPADLLWQLRAELDAAAGGDFLGQPAERRQALLVAHDAAAYAATGEGRDAAAWRSFKGLVLMGYYTSEVGASQELVYLPVPGGFEADLPLAPGQPGWSNDWWGNVF